ncbi:transporter substrate-binding domain-containing protein [Shewanella eurypsychrophilus]|uniref:Transporter substrate-binding domain-containing protein n=1 Tax=Shewanella eurypsychrophilus TaxID=2593656 RepID=A0ABX6V3L2_9GAMM|nr:MULTISPECIES: transporter substrate-binding domain-containing protein [Shewanella]QFU21657.1 transporter substrate-binding domain-containing protein [Shewanella sp. YLB-09]QPG56947.1 transporter substrate-binding domain-containing protein [Shewanella eurypsychrophilus]
MTTSSPIIEIRTIEILPYGIKTKISPSASSEYIPSGIYYDMANLLAEESGYLPHNEIYPYARIMLELKSGQTDMTIMYKYKELEDYVTYIAPLPSLKNVVIGLHGTSFSSFDNLKGKKLAYLRGAKFSDVIDNDPAIYRFETFDFIQAVKMLMAGHVDAVIGPMDAILSAALQLNEDINLFGEPFVVSQRTPWVQISNKSLHKFSPQRLKSSYEKIIERDELSKLRRKYLGYSQ